MSSTDFESVCDRLDIPAALRKHIAPGTAARGRMAVARGILPAPPKVLLGMQYLLLGDEDPRVAAEAEKSIVSMPTDRLIGVLGPKTHPKILELLAYRRGDDADLMEKVVLLSQVSDKTLCYLAENGTERVAEMISQNQERLIITPQIVRFLRKNPQVPASTIERCVTFLRLYGIEIPEPSAAEVAAAERARQDAREAELAQHEPDAPEPPPAAPTTAPATAGEARELPAGDGLLPSDFRDGEVYTPPAPEEPPPAIPGLVNPLAALLMDWGIELKPEYVGAPPPMPAGDDVAGPPIHPAAPQQPRAQASLNLDLSGLTSLSDTDFAFGFDEDDDDFDPYLTRESEEEANDVIKGNIKNMIQGLGVGDKIKLAYKGNKAVREVLIRDTNKIVSCAVVKSGRITENEVLSIAGNRAVPEDVIRELARVKEYLRKYPVKVALCSNPKTPVPVAMKLLNSLHISDLRGLANNRNVSSAVFTAANKLYKNKGAQRGG